MRGGCDDLSAFRLDRSAGAGAGRACRRRHTRNRAGPPPVRDRQFRTSWGEPDLQGIWSGETLTPLQRPARFANKPVLSPEEAAKVVAEVLRVRAAKTDPLAAPKKTSRAPTTSSLFSGRMNCRTAARRSSSIRPTGESPRSLREARKRIDEVRAYLQALLQGSSGGKAGPPSPRHAEPPPVYNVDRMNRANGPEDRSLAERCLAGTLPNLGAVYQIVQSPGQVGIYHDSGQGQGFRARRSRGWERACPGSHPLLER